MEQEKIILIVKATINPEAMDSFNAYIGRLTELFEKVKAESIGHFPIRETFVGNDAPTFIAIYRFENRQAFDEVYESEAYKNEMLPLRDKGFKNLEVYLS
jgi:uncharacterized protein (DUF1330 family)